MRLTVLDILQVDLVRLCGEGDGPAGGGGVYPLLGGGGLHGLGPLLLLDPHQARPGPGGAGEGRQVLARSAGHR